MAALKAQPQVHYSYSMPLSSCNNQFAADVGAYWRLIGLQSLVISNQLHNLVCSVSSAGWSDTQHTPLPIVAGPASLLMIMYLAAIGHEPDGCMQVVFWR